jgi:hypothetical protein
MGPERADAPGWSRNSMKIGDEVTVEGGQRENSNIGNARSVTLTGGQKLFAGSSQTTTP